MAHIRNARRVCPECGATFVATHGRQQFCSTGHKNAFHDRNAIRGKVVLPFILAWRSGKRGRSENSAYALQQLAMLADRWAAEDKAAGRRSDLIITGKRESFWNAADLDLHERVRSPTDRSEA